MDYKEGSMGLAIILGAILFIIFSFVFGFIGGFSGNWIVMAIMSFILAPVLTGAVAAIIAKGSAGRGFVAGFSSVLIGYYIFLVLTILLLAITMAGLGIPIDQVIAMAIGLPGVALSLILSIVLGVIVLPIILGIFGGIGGAIISAATATKANAHQPQAPAAAIHTTIIQAPASPVAAAAPIVINSASPAPPKAAEPVAAPAKVVAKTEVAKEASVSKLKCANCGAENKAGVTFCKSCGSRLKG